MLRSYLTIAIRNLRRHSGYAFINILGLSVGVACCLLAFLYIRYEYSFDAYHKKGDRVYRLISYTGFGEKHWQAFVSGEIAAAMRNTYTDVEDASRVIRSSIKTIVFQDEVHSDIRTIFTESSLFNILSLALIRGDATAVLDRPQTAVITNSLARSLFQDRDPVGQFIPLRLAGRNLEFEITGVTRDIPVNSYLRFDLLLSWESLRNTGSCLDCGQMVYVLLKPGRDPNVVAEQALSFIQNTRRKTDVDVEDLRLERLDHIHFSHIDGRGDIRYVYLLTSIATLVLLIACINYMNLATARSISRVKEVGVRKAVGACPFEIIRQFLAETLVLCVLALPAILVLLSTAIPYFNTLADSRLHLDLGASLDLFGALVAVLVLVALVAGSYPAFFLSRFRPTEMLMGRLPGKLSSLGLRRALIVFQFAASVVLIVATAVIFNQLSYMQNKNLGFDAEQVITLEITDPDLSQHPQRILDSFRRQSGVLSVSALQGAPGEDLFSGATFASRPFGGDQPTVQFVTTPIDTAFLSTFKIPLLEGRNVSHVTTPVSLDEEGLKAIGESPTEVLINEAGVKAMRWDGPEAALEKQVSIWRVVGVVADFNFQSLHREVQPLFLTQNRFGMSTTIAIRLAPGDVPGTISKLRMIWKNSDTVMPFEFRFLTEELDELYASEQRTAKIFGSFAGLAIFVSCLGLLGLAAFAAAQRTKEIGIRKVHGATSANIVALLTSEFVGLVIIAVVVAIPIAYILTRSWLQDFAFRIQLGFGPFLLAGLITMMIAVVTTGLQAMRAASVDPVSSLRWE